MLPDILTRHHTVTKNYGILGGWLVCTFWTFNNGDPTGITESHIVGG